MATFRKTRTRMSWLLSLGIWLGFRELYTENQACGGNFLVLKITLLSSITKRQLFVSLSLVFYFVFYTFPSAAWLMAQQNISVELKPKKNRQKGILYLERRRRKEKDVSLCCFSQASTKAMLKYQKGKLSSSYNNVFNFNNLHVLVSFFFPFFF